MALDHSTVLQEDASVIIGIFIFLALMGYAGRKYDPYLERKQKKEKLRFPAITVILFGP